MKKEHFTIKTIDAIRAEDYSPFTNDEKRHDNKDGPCKCGAWHNPSEFEQNPWMKDCTTKRQNPYAT